MTDIESSRSSLPVTVFAFACKNGLLYSEWCRTGVEGDRNRTLLLAADQRWEVSGISILAGER